MKKKQSNRASKGREATTRLLRLLEDAAVEAGEMFEVWASHKPYRLDPEDRLAEIRLEERRAFQKRVSYLRCKNLIRTKKTQEGLLYELSGEGRVELMKRIVLEKEMLSDGKVCLVMYDVPRVGNLGRDALRYFLKRIGFSQVQHSVWETDKDVVREVKEFVRMAKIKDWVEVYLAKRQ